MTQKFVKASSMRRIAAILAVIALLFSAGAAWADFDDGVAAYERGDYATAFREFLPDAEQGHAAAQFNLGVMHYEGWGVSRAPLFPHFLSDFPV